jgi:hypothetical protein
MNRQVLKPQNDVPLVVKLDKGPEGKPTAKNDFQYTVNDDQAVMWLPAEARTAIFRSHAQAGDEIEILKSARGWSVQVLSDASESAEDVPTPMPPARQMRVVAGQRTQGATALARRPQPQREQQLPQSEPMVDLLARLYVTAGRGLQKAHAQLVDEGIVIEAFNWEDIRATGNSLFIERNRREREQR